MGWSTFYAVLVPVCVVIMLTACSPPPPRHYPLAEPISPAMMRAEEPETYNGTSYAVSCSEEPVWCF